MNRQVITKCCTSTIFLACLLCMALLSPVPADAINHRVKVTNLTNYECGVTVLYGVFNKQKSHVFPASNNGALYTFEFGLKCPVGLNVVCLDRNKFPAKGFNTLVICADGRDSSNAQNCFFSCKSSQWHIWKDNQGNPRLDKVD